MFKTTLITLALACAVSAAKTDDGWSDVAYTDIYARLAPCARDCILNINQLTNCDTYGCVCSENTGGANFNAGVKNISECAKQSCSNYQDINDAAKVFRDLCNPINAARTSSASESSAKAAASATPTQYSSILSSLSTAASSTSTAAASTASTQSSSSSSPSAIVASSTSRAPILLIKPSKYDYLNACSKFCLNSCRDTNGTVNEPKCQPSEKPEGWDGYRGLANQLGCTTAECVCKSQAFNMAFGKLYQSGVKYCNLLPSTADLPVAEYDRLQGVLADYCTDNGFKPSGWHIEIEGRAPGTKPDSTGLSRDSKIALGVGLGVGPLTLALQAVGAYFSWVTYRADKKYLSEAHSP